MSLLLSRLSPDGVRAVFSDLDGTLTRDGMFGSDVLARIEALARRGVKLVIVSGRPAGWADTLMRLLPLDAMIFENGAGVAERVGKKIEARAFAPEPDAGGRARLQTIFEGLRKRFPELRLAKDQPFRRYDYAIDIAEEAPHLEPATLKAVMDELGGMTGITVKLSNIHINYWNGTYDKLSACRALFASASFLHGVSPEDTVFSGDSPNDEPLFGFFPRSVGMANLADFPPLGSPPRFLASGREADGFCELADRILSERA